MRSFKKIIMALALVVLVSACSEMGSGTSPKDLYAGPAGNTGAEGPFGARVGNVIVGSQRDLAINVGDRVFFETDQFDLSSQARDVLRRQATFFKRHSQLNVTIEGHADERGTREYNLALGDRRANAVRDFLISQGVDASRISVISYGKERPAVLGSNPAAWAQNRRAVTVIQ